MISLHHAHIQITYKDANIECTCNRLFLQYILMIILYDIIVDFLDLGHW